MTWLILWVVGLALATLLGHGMGVRRERARHARWASIQETHRAQHSGGVRLRRIVLGR